MNANDKKTLWDSIPKYQRRNPKSVKPPSERIDPDLPGAHFWVILVKNWEKMHPLVQDVLYEWYIALSQTKGDFVEELDPKSTEALMNRLEVLDQKLSAFDLERTNLEQELRIRDRDFQQLRSITGKRERENIEVQHQLGKNFQEKIMEKQEEIDQQAEYIRQLEARLEKSESGVIEANQQTEEKSAEKDNQIKELTEKIKDLENEIIQKDNKIKEIKELLNL